MHRRWKLSCLVVAALAAAGAGAFAQSALRARTETGREVILRPDGTWAFADQAAPAQPAPQPQAGQPPQPARPPLAPLFPSNPPPPRTNQVQPPQPTASPPARPPAPAARTDTSPIVRPADATTALNARRGGFRLWYNAAKWRPSPENPDGRVQLQLIGNEVYMVLIPEGAPLPIAQLRTVALENARQSGADARIVSERTRSIAGRDVLEMQISVTIDQLPVAFLGYYFGDPRGSIQLVAFTAQKDLQRYRAQIQEGLDGLDLNR